MTKKSVASIEKAIKASARKVARPLKKAKARGKRASKLGVVNVKMSAADRKVVTTNAKRWAKGNLSAWIRESGKLYTPKKGEKITLKAA